MDGRSAPRTVVVTGATGRQGSAVARHLLAAGVTVRALTRSPAGPRAQALAHRGAIVFRGDMEERATLERAFHRADGVFCVQNPMTSGTEAEIRQGRAVAAVAAATGVSHVVYGAAGTGRPGTGVPSWESKLEIERHMRELEVPLTVLRPMAFMELMTDKGYYPSVSTWQLMPSLMGEDRPVGWICTDDLGAIAARIFLDRSRYVGRELPLTTDVRSIRECRELWRRVTGRRPRRFPVPVRLFERFVGPDLPTMWRWLRAGDIDLSTDVARTILPEAASVESWLSAHFHPASARPAR